MVLQKDVIEAADKVATEKIKDAIKEFEIAVGMRVVEIQAEREGVNGRGDFKEIHFYAVLPEKVK